MKKKVMVFLVVLIILSSLAGYKLYINGKNNGKISATGTIEVTKVDITPEVYGYIEKLDIDSGLKVTRGALAAVLARPDLSAGVKRDEAGLTKAKVQLTDLEKGARLQEVNDVVASESSLQAVYALTEKNLERSEQLYSAGAIPAQSLDKARSDRDAAYQIWQAATAKRALVQDGYRKDVIEAQRIEVERSGAVLEATKSLAQYINVLVPVDGVILSKNFEQGEYVNAGAAIATIGVMNDCWVKVYVPTEMIGRVKVGQVASVKIDSFPEQSFKGWVKEIGQQAEFTPRQTITPKERANQVFYVKVQLDNGEGYMKPGMPADVVFDE